LPQNGKKLNRQHTHARARGNLSKMACFPKLTQCNTHARARGNVVKNGKLSENHTPARMG